MKTIKNNTNNEIIIKNSKFICYLYKIKSLDEALNILQILKQKHKDATHHCYAYIIDNIKKSSDDGEPGGTAGIPILKVLENSNLTNVLAVVIRYFGGIKLGAGGLVRAYTKSITNTIKNDNLSNISHGYNIDIEFNYNRQKEIDYLLKNITINNKSFNTTIKYNINIKENDLKILKTNNISYTIIKELNIED